MKIIPQLALLLTLFLIGCQPTFPKPDLVIVNGKDPTTLDPATATGIEDLRILLALHEGLTRRDPQTSEPIPGLAERWDLSPDGLTYTFYLRPGLHWDENHPITTDDVIFSWTRALTPSTASDYANLLFPIKNAQAFHRGTLAPNQALGLLALSPTTLQVQLEYPVPFFLDLCSLATLAILPRFHLEAHPKDWLKLPSFPTSGPYRLLDWKLNDRVQLLQNPFYWNTSQTKSSRIDLLSCQSANTAFNLYEAGAVDIVWDKQLLPAELTDLLIQREDFHVYQFLATYFLRFNTTRPPLDNPNVRLALSLAIDRQRIVDKITRGGEQPATSFVPPGTARFHSKASLQFDPQKAKSLLSQAGYANGDNFPTLSYLFDGGGGGHLHASIAIEIQEMWRETLNIQVQLRPMEKKAYFSAQNALDYDISRSSWVGDYNDAGTFLDLFETGNGNNRTGWSSSAYDTFIQNARTETQSSLRQEWLQQAETLLIENQAPIAALFYYSGIHCYRPNQIRGIYPNILDLHPLQTIERMDTPDNQNPE